MPDRRRLHRMVQAAGLAGQARPSMGRIDARFADWRIGACSHVVQLWVDRTVALDYTLKSLEKILDGDPREHVHAARVVIRDAAFTVLERMCGLLAACPETAGAVSGQAGIGRRALCPARSATRRAPAAHGCCAWLRSAPGHYLVRHRSQGVRAPWFALTPATVGAGSCG